MLHGDIQPVPNASVPYGGVLDDGMAAELAGRALDVHQAAVVSGCKRVPPCDHYGKRPVHASLRGRVVQCGYCWIVSQHGHQRRRAEWG